MGIMRDSTISLIAYVWFELIDWLTYKVTTSARILSVANLVTYFKHFYLSQKRSDANQIWKRGFHLSAKFVHVMLSHWGFVQKNDCSFHLLRRIKIRSEKPNTIKGMYKKWARVIAVFAKKQTKHYFNTCNC